MSAPIKINPIFLFGTAAALLIWVPYLALGSIQEGEFSLELVVSICLLIIAALRLTVISALGKPKFLTITFYSFVYVWIGIAATAQVYANQYPWTVAHSRDAVLPAMLIVALAVVAYEIGVLSVRIRPPSSRRHWFEGMNFAMSDRGVFWLAIVSIALALLGIVLWGPNHLFITRAQVDLVQGNLAGSNKAMSLITKTFLRVPSLVGFIVVAYNGLMRWKTLDRQRKRYYFVLAGLLGLLNIATNYPPAQARHWLGVVLMAPAFALVPWRRWLAPFWIVGLCVGLIVVFPYSDLFRNANTWDEAIESVKNSAPVTKQLLGKGDYDVFQMTINGYEYTQDFGVAWGRNLLGAAAFWFPRSMWPSKPEGTGYIVGKASHYQMLNLSAPLWMEFDYAFGWMGVGFLMFFYGRISGQAERHYDRSVEANEPLSLARVLVPYWAGFQMFILRGDLLNVTAYSSFGLAMLLITAALTRERRKVPAIRPLGTLRG